MIKCKLGPETKNLQRHHIIPLAQGGDKGFLNRMIVCRKHHSLLHGRLIGGLAIRSTRFPGEHIGFQRLVFPKMRITREELLRDNFYADLKQKCLNRKGFLCRLTIFRCSFDTCPLLGRSYLEYCREHLGLDPDEIVS